MCSFSVTPMQKHGEYWLLIACVHYFLGFHHGVIEKLPACEPCWKSQRANTRRVLGKRRLPEPACRTMAEMCQTGSCVAPAASRGNPLAGGRFVSSGPRRSGGSEGEKNWPVRSRKKDAKRPRAVPEVTSRRSERLPPAAVPRSGQRPLRSRGFPALEGHDEIKPAGQLADLRDRTPVREKRRWKYSKPKRELRVREVLSGGSTAVRATPSNPPTRVARGELG